MCVLFFFFKQKTAYEMRISDWSSDVCSSDLGELLIADDIDLPDFGFRPFINFKDDVDTILIQLHHLRINCCRETALTPVQLDNAGNVSPYLGLRKNLTRRQLDFRLNLFVLQPLLALHHNAVDDGSFFFLTC